jgi:hypothetical protein
VAKLWELNQVYGEDGKPIVTYAGRVRKMYEDHEELVFFLSQNSNESIADIRRMTLGERISFQKRLTKYLQDKAQRGRKGGESPE